MAKHKKKKKKDKKKGAGKGSLAERFDKHVLYEAAVQSPEADIEFFDKVYRQTRGQAPVRLREDFCGTAKLSVTWCASSDERRAFGVDLDEATLAWGQRVNVEPVAEQIGDRLELVRGDVRDALMPADGVGADVNCAMNFSFCVFKTRAELLRYLKAAFATTAPGGLFFMEMYGGSEAMTELEDDRDVEDEELGLEFVYRWEQASFNPITHETLCHIHFVFEDGSKIARAFTYDWRLWTLPELRELLLEAGFDKVRVFWETVEDDEDDPDIMTGTGEYEEVEEVENQDAWLVYVVGERAEA